MYLNPMFMMQLIEMYSSKQRTGVLDVESGLEAYIVPPCQLVDRLLKTAKKSAMLATHSATSIPDTIEDSQLLLVVIHRKVRSNLFKHYHVSTAAVSLMTLQIVTFPNDLLQVT